MRELPEGCPACGALPCDWANDPHSAAYVRRIEALTEALEVFANFAEVHVDADGWNGPMSTTRIVDWFGPTDFREARAALHIRDGE